MNRHRVRVGLVAAIALLVQTALAGPIAAAPKYAPTTPETRSPPGARRRLDLYAGSSHRVIGKQIRDR